MTLALTPHVSDPERAFPILTPTQIARLAEHGERRRTKYGELLYDAGEKHVPMFVVVSGELQVVRQDETGETLLGFHSARPHPDRRRAERNSAGRLHPDLSSEELSETKWPLSRSPYLLETNRPGIFAVGDVRSGNVKRVASAVGEGSIAVAFVHQAQRQ